MRTSLTSLLACSMWVASFFMRSSKREKSFASLPSSSLMTWAMRRVSESRITARAVLSTAISVLGEVRMVGVDLGEHCRGRQEHHGAVGGFAFDDVLGGNVVDMLPDISLELPSCGVALDQQQADDEHAAVVFQRELGIDADHAGRGGQDQHAI